MNKNNDELLETMELCGHFLYHRRGGKRGQNRILRILCVEGDISQKELQKRLDIQSGSLSEIVIKMEANGLIERKKQEEDKRNIILNITDKGRDAYEEYRNVIKKQNGVIFDALTDKEQAELLALLSKLLEDWNENFAEILATHKSGKETDNV